MLLKLACVALGGALGATIRYALSGWAAAHLGEGFPWGTLIVNLTGCFLIGLLAVVLGAVPGQEQLKPLIITGFLGALTTFSTFAFESWRDIEAGKLLTPALNIGVSCVVGLLLVSLGLRLGRMAVAVMAGGAPEGG